MAELCDFAIAADVAVDCDKPLVAGVENEGVIGNFADIDTVTYDSENPNIVTGITMKTGKKMYSVQIPGRTPFNGTQTALAAGTYLNGFTHTLALVVLNAGPDVSKDIIDPLANGKFFAILRNKNAGADGKNTFQIYGLEAGLYATATDNAKYSEDTKGGWAVTLEETAVPHSGIFFCKEDNQGHYSLEATVAAVESLKTAAS